MYVPEDQFVSCNGCLTMWVRPINLCLQLVKKKLAKKTLHGVIPKQHGVTPTLHWVIRPYTGPIRTVYNAYTFFIRPRKIEIEIYTG